MFTVVIVPIGVRQKGFSDISFLGSVLDKESFWHELETLKMSSVLDQKGLGAPILLHKDALTTEPIKAPFHKSTRLDESHYKPNASEVIKKKKEFLVVSGDKDLAREEAGLSIIEGRAKERSIIFRPSPPDYKEVIVLSQETAGAHFKVKLRIIISPDGSVKAVDNLETSGRPEIDLIAARYLKKWKFSSLSPDKPQEDQEGIISLEIK